MRIKTVYVIYKFMEILQTKNILYIPHIAHIIIVSSRVVRKLLSCDWELRNLSAIFILWTKLIFINVFMCIHNEWECFRLSSTNLKNLWMLYIPTYYTSDVDWHLFVNAKSSFCLFKKCIHILNRPLSCLLFSC